MSDTLQSARRVLAIPARRQSTRLPDKLLLRDTGRTVLEHTYNVACRSKRADAVLIATDDDMIAAEARRLGAQVAVTCPSCPSGTDRIAEAVRRLPKAEIIVNLQGDEPEADPETIDRLFEHLEAHPEAKMATLAAPIRSREALEDPACVKVTFDASGRAMYFSRSPIPLARQWNDSLLTAKTPVFYQHIGMYAYRRSLLMQIPLWPVGRLEQVEKLEQLRVLEQGEPILVVVTDRATRGIDTPEDYAAFVARRKAG